MMEHEQSFNATTKSIGLDTMRALTVVMIGAVAFIAALLILDVPDVTWFLAYFVLIPVANICFAIAIWIFVSRVMQDN